jgi:hypothetical protein
MGHLDLDEAGAMTRVNLDAQPEVVRQFVLELSAAPGATMLESAGRGVACVIPTPSAEGGPPDDDWTEQKNRRRGALLDHKYDHGLTAAEEAELALLQDAMYRYIDRVAPLPLEEARNLHQELLQKATQVQRVEPA